ncbi:hypothetical protein [Saccharomonospora iraqiensis]|uniref:hypothetical protein n=1 Tax=Saccharomonospora iraqiensis TaxID=52698 RepID=UPI00022E03A6|nr:hypothetical protein [Saccharomonospora iraqiensis]
MATPDLRGFQLDDVLPQVEKRLGVRLDPASAVYGESGATVGFATATGTWVRLRRRAQHRIHSAAWVGLEASATVRGVRKPAWHQSATWTDLGRDLVWRADEMELISAPVVDDPADAAALPVSWWARLRESLAALAAHETERVGMSQRHVTRRVREVFGSAVDVTVDDWTTAHTDLHWGNVTTEAQLLDWEDWGLAPAGLDAATLWQAALPFPAVAARVEDGFAAELTTRSGRIARLLQCANAIRAAGRLGHPTPLSRPATNAARELIASLRIE